MADAERFEMRVSAEWLAMVDGARGGESRGGFVKRVMEGALGGYEPVPESARVVPLAKAALEAVPAARVTRLADHARERRVVEEITPDARRVAAGLPPLRAWVAFSVA